MFCRNFSWAHLHRERGDAQMAAAGLLCEASPPAPRGSQSWSSPTHLACLMAPSKVLKRAPHSSTTQWKCTLCRKSHCASQKSLVPNLAKANKPHLTQGPRREAVLEQTWKKRFFLFLNSNSILFSHVSVPPAQTGIAVGSRLVAQI